MVIVQEKLPVVSYVAIDNKKISVVKNPNAERTAFQHTKEFLNSSNAVFRCFQLADRTLKLVVEALKRVGSPMVGYLEGIASKFTVAWTSTSILRLPDVTSRAIQSINDLNTDIADTATDFTRKSVKAVHDFFEMATMYFYSGAFFWAPLKIVGDIPDFISNATELQLNAQDLHLTTRAIKVASAQNCSVEVEQALSHTQRNSFIKTLKAACSVASGVLGLSVMMLGGPILPAVALVTLSLAGTILAMTSHFYQESSPFKMVDFFDRRSIEILPLAAG